MKIKYCKKCGSKIVDGSFCPICGEKINQEGINMDKNKRTRKILLIILAIVVLGGLLLIGGAYNSNNKKTFVKHNFSETCSVELPNWIKFNEGGVGSINGDANIAGSNVQSTTKALFGNNQVMQITYSKTTVDGSSVGGDLNNAMNVNMGNKKINTRTVTSSETGEAITVMGENETLVNYIAEHTLFNGKHGSNNTKTTNDSTVSNQQSGNTANNNNQQKALAYKSDGTPMYDYREVDSYMERKYGDKVEYHIQDNGYISHDGYRQSGQESTPYDTGGRGSGGSGSTAT